jgi:hypothetical protein
MNRVRTAANQAIPLLQQFDSANKALIAEMYFARGFAEMQLALDFCNGHSAQRRCRDRRGLRLAAHNGRGLCCRRGLIRHGDRQGRH